MEFPILSPFRIGSKPLIKALLFLCLALLSDAQTQQTCLSRTFSNSLTYPLCTDLLLGCEIHWNPNTNGTVSVSFGCSGVSATSPKWIAWGTNFNSNRMVGTQSLVAHLTSSGQAQVQTTSVDSYTTTLPNSTLSFSVSGLAVDFSGSRLTIFANLQLPTTTGINQVWQVGDMNGNSFLPHPTTGDNVRSSATWNLNSTVSTSAGGIPRIKRKNIHGVLNAVSWGILMPMGAMTARYLKVSRAADPAWFYLHISCQVSAYIVGVAGWGTGLKLGSDSKGIKYGPHRNIGITLFCLATLQVFALLLRPKKDHKYRLYWNIYHHAVGYTVIILSVVNIYKGFDILNPEKKWKNAYTGIIISLGAVAAVLEALTWVIVLRRKKTGSDKSHHGANAL